MRIGFKLNKIRKGGSLEDLYYDQVITTGRKVKDDRGYRAVDIDDSEVPWAFLVANKDDIAIEFADIFVELPVSFKTVSAPSWFPNRTSFDSETGEEVVKDLGEFQIREDSLDGNKFVLKIQGQKAGDQLTIINEVVDFLAAQPTANAGLVDEARNLLNGAGYTVPE